MRAIRIKLLAYLFLSFTKCNNMYVAQEVNALVNVLV